MSAIRKEKDPDSSLVEEKATIVKRLLAEVELGVEEAQMMAQLASHLSSLEGDRAKLKAQVRAHFASCCFDVRFLGTKTSGGKRLAARRTVKYAIETVRFGNASNESRGRTRTLQVYGRTESVDRS